ncbi:MAG TPA: ABC transporter substrate-binding protein [Candidatus Limnocylindrales bacterium]
MRLPLRARMGRVLAVVGLVAALLLPAAVPTTAQTVNVIRVGTDQDVQVLNPWSSILVVDYEVFTLNYDLLVGFGQNLEPVPGFAESWSSSADGMTHTFKIRPGMTWSDGTPATSEDARYTYQLVLDGVASERGYLGSGYLEPYLTNAGISTVTAPDPLTLVVTTEFPTTLLTQAYVPILPKHIWEQYTIAQIGDDTADGFFRNEPPVVGTGPYQAVEWEPGQFIRFARNESYWGDKGAADEIIVTNFDSTDTMVTALKNGDVDYVRGVGADQFDALANEPNIVAVEGFSNGYTYLSFNTRGNAEGYGGSTSALSDVAFRDALGYAIDTTRLVDATLAGHGVVGSTNVPPYHANFHVEPTTPRTFDIEEAKRRLDAAGYGLDGAGKRLDKDGQPITLRLTWPDSEEENQVNAQFITGWFADLGITVDAAVTEEGKLSTDLLGPPDGQANWDFYMWGWVGDPDPMSLLSFFTSDQLGGLNDSFFTNERYDELFALQQRAVDETQRKTYIAEMQQIFYDQAPYHVLYYDNELHAYRTDKFSGWINQPPENGTPLFGYGPIGYTKLTLASEASPAPTTAAPSGAATPAPSGDGGTGGTASDSTPLIIGGIAVLAVVVGGGLLLMRRRGSAAEEEE